MKYATVCSGIKAPSVAWHSLGFEPVFFSEIEKFPSAVLAHHYPHVPNRGDMTKFKEWPDATFDVLCGGTPCQSFSIAGLRKGVDDPRGNLMLTYLAIAARYRPRWLVWENVPGVLSSNGGRDFGSFLWALGQLGYGFAYRVLDARYFALAQRRARVFVVGYLGDWRRPAAVLFERESLQGHPAPRREAGKRVTGILASRTTGGGGLAYTLEARSEVQAVAHTLRGRGRGHDASEDGTGRGIPLVPVAFQSKASAQQSMNPGCLVPSLDVSKAGGMAVAFHENQRGEISCNATLGSLKVGGGKPGQGYPAGAVALRGREGGVAAELSDIPSAPRASQGGSDKAHILNAMAVRRLTPRECERLQGFPDDYTLIPYGRGTSKDGPRYKALGNSMAVPVMRWIGERIELCDAI